MTAYRYLLMNQIWCLQLPEATPTVFPSFLLVILRLFSSLTKRFVAREFLTQIRQERKAPSQRQSNVTSFNEPLGQEKCPFNEPLGLKKKKKKLLPCRRNYSTADLPKCWMAGSRHIAASLSIAVLPALNPSAIIPPTGCQHFMPAHPMESIVLDPLNKSNTNSYQALRVYSGSIPAP